MSALDPYLDAAGDAAQGTLRRVGLMVAGFGFLAGGVGMLTVAAWLMLDDAYGPLAAWASLGAVYVGAGLVVAATGSASSRTQPRTQDRDRERAREHERLAALARGQNTMAILAEAFALAFISGIKGPPRS